MDQPSCYNPVVAKFVNTIHNSATAEIVSKSCVDWEKVLIQLKIILS